MTAAATAPPEAFRLRESATLRQSVLAQDGTIELEVIRPTIGRGPGRHLYTAEMLAENAHKFAGWRMFNNHLSETARRQLGGLPRPIEDTGGRILESWWDPDVPAEGRFDRGAVVARVRPVGIARKLIEEDPKILEASINASATAVRPVTKDGVKCWLVEGIQDTGSVDWVSEAGAGGRVRVASLMEAWHHDDKGQAMAQLDALTDTELVAKLRRERPALIEALVDEGGEGGRNPEEGGGDVQTPVEVLREALATDEGQEALTDFVSRLVEAKVAEERDFIIAEARADADRQVELRDMRDTAHTLIREAALPGSLQDQLLGRFQLQENGPTRDLDVVDEVGEDGEVKRRASEVLREAVEAQIEQARELIREAAGPARVVGQGGGGDGTKPTGRAAEPLYKRQLREAGITTADQKED